MKVLHKFALNYRLILIINSLNKTRYFIASCWNKILLFFMLLKQQGCKIIQLYNKRLWRKTIFFCFYNARHTQNWQTITTEFICIQSKFKPVHLWDKSEPLCNGLFKIISKPTEVTNELLIHDGRSFRTHRNHLIPYCQTNLCFFFTMNHKQKKIM